MKTPFNCSENGVDFIKHHELCVLHTYGDEDVPPVPTIGWGHAYYYGPSPISQQTADLFLLNDLQRYVACVNRYVTWDGLNQNMFDALVSFSFNEGVGALPQSTLLKVLNTGDFQTASLHFAEWNKRPGPDGKLVVSSILSARRSDEKLLFLSPPVLKIANPVLMPPAFGPVA